MCVPSISTQPVSELGQWLHTIDRRLLELRVGEPIDFASVTFTKSPPLLPFEGLQPALRPPTTGFSAPKRLYWLSTLPFRAQPNASCWRSRSRRTLVTNGWLQVAVRLTAGVHVTSVSGGGAVSVSGDRCVRFRLDRFGRDPNRPRRLPPSQFAVALVHESLTDFNEEAMMIPDGTGAFSLSAHGCF